MNTENKQQEHTTEAKRRRIYRILVEEIAAGKFVALGPFPSERSLTRRFNVARETIRLVMHELQEKGLVFSLQGRGTFIAPNKVATGRSSEGQRIARRKIGVIVTGGHYSEIFARICKELRSQAAEQGVELAVGDVSDRDGDLAGPAMCDLVRRMVAEGVIGMILQPLEYGPSCHEQNEEVLSIIEKAHVPLVLIDSDVDTTRQNRSYDVIGIDNLSAGAVVMRHLCDGGARRIRFLVHDCEAESIRMRIAGCHLYGQEMWGPMIIRINPADVQAVRSLFFSDPEIDAVICQNDVAAVKLMASLRQLGLRVPEDVRVAGFDDVSLASCVKPALTTVRQPCDKIAAQALHLLMKRIVQPGRSCCRHLLHATLIVRQSTVL